MSLIAKSNCQRVLINAENALRKFIETEFRWAHENTHFIEFWVLNQLIESLCALVLRDEKNSQ